MSNSQIESEFLSYLLERQVKPGERLPSLANLSEEIGVSISKLREQFEVAKMLGLVEAKPRRGITCTEYNFAPPVTLSLLAALAIQPKHFDAYSSLRVHLESAFWNEAVTLLTDSDIAYLQELVEKATTLLQQPRIRIPHLEHRELHLTIFSRLENPFVAGLLEAYWDAYEAVELNTYADYEYLQRVWRYHRQIVEAITVGDFDEGKRLLIEHTQLLSSHGISTESRVQIGESIVK